VTKPLEERADVGRRDGRRWIADGVRGEEIGVDRLLVAGSLGAIARLERTDALASRRGTAAPRDGVEGDPEFQDGLGVFAGPVPAGRVGALETVSRSGVVNGDRSGGEGPSRLPAQETNGKPARAGFPSG